MYNIVPISREESCIKWLLKNSLWSPWTGDQNQGQVSKSLIL